MLPPTSPLIVSPEFRNGRGSRTSVRSSLIVVRVDLRCWVEPDVVPIAASQGRWFRNRPNSDTYVSRPALLLRWRPGAIANENCCEPIHRFVCSVLYSFAACHCSDGCGLVPADKNTGVPSGMYPCLTSNVGGMLMSVWSRPENESSE